MGSADNRLRKKWQDYSGINASAAENDFYTAFHDFFEETEFTIRAQPNEFNKIYIDVELPEEVLSEIYNPPKPIKRHGVFPDYAIGNGITGKTIYIEVKRQDGWVEGGKRSDGRGNAHERSCKFFTPGLLKKLREHGHLGDSVLPFWTVFQGNITRDPCRVREVTSWYEGYEDHFFFWRDTRDSKPLLEHFINHIMPLLV
ncbi:MunI family type II restriction endonuclease [Acidithiobacillus ferrivorans]|uniref:MunI family type II restriction endonuclease n=1 Tax=Acidithiobacillus ferrivorans TaxID=160808 RepID=UPI0009F7327D|nr:MunI family type II restriction endonuclease [Acidithiobacillus ferrivorans]